MRVTRRVGFRTCTECHKTRRWAYIVVIGDVSLTLCEDHLRRLNTESGKKLRSLEREREEEERIKQFAI